ncbi:hypothetical protein [Epilithonimonas tenax]|uniref:hypothetical protein n=1 Tax=Epilithonimonas tenax TaxID=191577 RepID=UPI000406A069|nr:hypothetical protein [Epilithonimonas tenax]
MDLGGLILKGLAPIAAASFFGIAFPTAIYVLRSSAMAKKIERKAGLSSSKMEL